MKKPLLIANWKSNPETAGEAVDFAIAIEEVARQYKHVDIVIAPPFPFLLPIVEHLKKATLGAQDAFWSGGPYTGEVSWSQLRGLGVSMVIVGHSERRIFLKEDDAMIAKKTRALLEHRIHAVVCIGEHERQEDEIPPDVAEQLRSVLTGLSRSLLRHLVIAYEPIWAISTNPGAKPDTPENAFRVMLYIRRILAETFGRPAAEGVRVIYGGSVHAENIKSFLIEGRMDGALVGKASLDIKEFSKMIAVVDSMK